MLEIVWTLIPALILVFMGAYSVKYVYAMQVPPANEYVIHVTGHEWYWEFKYPNGVDTHNDLHVPAGQNVLFDITSNDVIHGFYIPAARLQQDAVPGRQTQYYVNAKTAEVGQVFPIPCDQFCGVGHPAMIAHMTVDSKSTFNAWLSNELRKQNSASSGS